ncbi:MAG: hypothetical protein DMF74_22920 [Acidobacteria bacterium]|nr:MAG: hypothetical protein DMF74_22920 [Acidobacteriota bacterium]
MSPQTRRWRDLRGWRISQRRVTTGIVVATRVSLSEVDASVKIGADGGSRTHTTLRSTDFKNVGDGAPTFNSISQVELVARACPLPDT